MRLNIFCHGQPQPPQHPSPNCGPTVADLSQKLDELLELSQKGFTSIMAAFDDLSTAVDKLTTDLSAKFADLTTEIQNLKNSGGATPEQLAALQDKITSLDTTVTNFSA